MHESIFFGGSLIAAGVAGAIALFAPCCISVMLPAYFASSFPNRGRLVAMSFLFAAGVATVILPIALGAATLLRLITAGHTILYVTGGLLMLALGVYTLAGGRMNLPMPGRQAGSSTGPLGIYSLGLFSGTASSCCAPVLAGLIGLSGLAASIPLALGLGLAYVVGMVAPLFVIALLWDAFDWKSSWLFRPRTYTWRIGSMSRTLGASELASGLLLVLIGVGAIYVGFAGQAMPGSGDWQARFSVTLQQYGQDLTQWLGRVPNWLAAILLVALLLLLGRLAVHQVGWWRARQEADLEDSTPKDIDVGKIREATQKV